MLKQRREAAQQVADSLFESEAAIDAAITAVAKLAGVMPAVRADARMSQIPIIALSSITAPATIERGRQAGFHDFVAKFDRQRLIASLKESCIEWVEAA